MATQSTVSDVALSPEQLRAHWQGHRRLSRRVVEAFPEEKLFDFSVGGMRPFGELALEMLGMVAMLREIVGEATQTYATPRLTEEVKQAPHPKRELLRRWDEATSQIDELWARIPPGRFQERMTAFGQYEGPIHELMLYVIDNEVHHRGQGYVYLRALGIEPPPFWERG